MSSRMLRMSRWHYGWKQCVMTGWMCERTGEQDAEHTCEDHVDPQMLPCIRSLTSKNDPVRSVRDETILSEWFLWFAANEDLTNDSFRIILPLLLERLWHIWLTTTSSSGRVETDLMHPLSLSVRARICLWVYACLWQSRAYNAQSRGWELFWLVDPEKPNILKCVSVRAVCNKSLNVVFIIMLYWC